MRKFLTYLVAAWLVALTALPVPTLAAFKYWNPYSVTGAVAGGTGGTECLLTVSPAIVGSGLVTGDTVTTRSIGGVTGCTGTFVVTVRSTTTISLNSSTFGGTFTSGGCVDGGHWTATNTANWATSSTATCGSGNTAVPTSADFPTFDANSGGSGTVGSNLIFVDASLGSFSTQGVSAGALNGTLDWTGEAGQTITATNTGFSWTGSGVRKFVWPVMTFVGNCGNCNAWSIQTTTGLDASTDSSNVSVILPPVTGTLSQTVITGGKALALVSVTMTGRTSSGPLNFSGPGDTFTNLTFTGTPSLSQTVQIANTSTGLNLPNGYSCSGCDAAHQIHWESANTSTNGIVTVPSGWTTNYTQLRGVNVKVGGVACTNCTANNSLDMGNNSGIVINPPTFGGGTRFIGG